jgi:hypothetical protein
MRHKAMFQVLYIVLHGQDYFSLNKLCLRAKREDYKKLPSQHLHFLKKKLFMQHITILNSVAIVLLPIQKFARLPCCYY